MKGTQSPPPADAEEEISALVKTLHDTRQRLEELTAGGVGSVADRNGRTFMLRQVQEQLRRTETARQAAILDALPANIALLDSRGIIVLVNEAWRRFGRANAIQGPGHQIGTNYLEICECAHGEDAPGARQAARGIRSVLDGKGKNFSLEYPCHSPTQQRWFLMTVTPLAESPPQGAVVMHLSITERKKAEATIAYLNRVHAMLSEISQLIVRVRDRDELFQGACRIAVESGAFSMSMIGTVDRVTMMINPVATAGKDDELQAAVRRLSSSREVASTTMVARAVREKTAVVSNDSKNDLQVLLGRQYAEAGIRSMAVLPLINSGEAVGVFALFAGETELFHEEEIKLLAALADDISFAMDHIDKRDRLDYLDYYDVLTGLANRTLFLERVSQHMRSAVSCGHGLALFLIDLERFKNVNDSLGRPAGDVLLKKVADWLTHNAAGGDANLLARVGTDQFAIVLPEVKREGSVARLVGKTLDAFLAHPFHLNDAVLRISAKVGVALFPDDGSKADTLLRNAEAALRKTKLSGDRYLFYTQNMNDAVAGKLILENQLRRALDKGEFVLHYQPKVNLASGELTGAEALIRLIDPRTRDLVPPGRFIPVLEETGLIHEAGRWALTQVLKEYQRWRAAGLAVVRIAVNVSPLQLRNRGLITEIRQAIGNDASAAAGLELEITENVIMENVAFIITHLQAIRTLGVKITIDDFGTGFSSLSHLARLPVDTLKIDRSFIADLTVKSKGLALVSTIINLAHSLELKAVAEGVETEEQLRLLRLLDCDEMQGFLFSKPVPAEIFETRFLSPPTPPDEE